VFACRWEAEGWARGVVWECRTEANHHALSLAERFLRNLRCGIHFRSEDELRKDALAGTPELGRKGLVVFLLLKHIIRYHPLQQLDRDPEMIGAA